MDAKANAGRPTLDQLHENLINADAAVDGVLQAKDAFEDRHRGETGRTIEAEIARHNHLEAVNGNRAEKAWRAFIERRPKDLDELGTYVRVIANNYRSGEGVVEDSEFRCVIRQIDAALSAVNQPAADPIFAEIETLQSLMDENDAAVKDEKLGAEGAAERLEQAGTKWIRQLQVVVKTAPKSLRGLELLMRFMISFNEEWGGGDDEVMRFPEWMEMLRSILRFAATPKRRR